MGCIHGHAYHEKCLQRQEGDGSLCSSQERRAPPVLRINRSSPTCQPLAVTLDAVCIGFLLFVLPRKRPGWQSSAPWGTKMDGFSRTHRSTPFLGTCTRHHAIPPRRALRRPAPPPPAPASPVLPHLVPPDKSNYLIAFSNKPVAYSNSHPPHSPLGPEVRETLFLDVRMRCSRTFLA